MDRLTEFTDVAFTRFLEYLPSLIMAIIIFIVGLWLIKIITASLRKLFDRQHFENTLKNFLLTLINIGLKIILVIMVIAKLGVQTTSFIAVLGAAGLAVGMALQGSLSNFAGGVLIILLKPFRIGDYIVTSNFSGTVKEVSIFYTRVIDDNKLLLVIPNGQLSNNMVKNVSAEGVRLDIIPVFVENGTDIQKARKVLIDLMASQKGVFENPGPAVTVSEITPNGIKLSLSFTSKTSDFWGIHFAILDQVETSLSNAGIKLSTQKMNVHLANGENKLPENRADRVE